MTTVADFAQASAPAEPAQPRVPIDRIGVDLSAVSDVIGNVISEIIRSTAKHGNQDHLLDGTGPDLPFPSPNIPCRRDEAAEALKARCKDVSQNEGGDGTITWEHILTEEWGEAIAESDPDALDAELVQLLAVGVKWLVALRKRRTVVGG